MKFIRTSIISMLSLFLLSPAVFADSLDEKRDEADGSRAQVTDYAGSGIFSLTNGTLDRAAFRSPERVAIGSDGTVFVADTLNQVIRQIKDGKVSTFSGTTFTMDEAGMPEGAFIDGSAGESLYDHPKGLAIGLEGEVYIADTGNHAIRKIDSNGTVTTIAGTGIV